jgi:hypothetical protein
MTSSEIILRGSFFWTGIVSFVYEALRARNPKAGTQQRSLLTPADTETMRPKIYVGVLHQTFDHFGYYATGISKINERNIFLEIRTKTGHVSVKS